MNSPMSDGSLQSDTDGWSSAMNTPDIESDALSEADQLGDFLDDVSAQLNLPSLAFCPATDHCSSPLPRPKSQFFEGDGTANILDELLAPDDGSGGNTPGSGGSGNSGSIGSDGVGHDAAFDIAVGVVVPPPALIAPPTVRTPPSAPLAAPAMDATAASSSSAPAPAAAAHARPTVPHARNAARLPASAIAAEVAAFDGGGLAWGDALVQVKLATPMLPKYWRNARSNLQCFPSCCEFGTYTAFRDSGRAHKGTAGQCKGAVRVRLGPVLAGCELRHPERMTLLARFTPAHEAVATHKRAMAGALRLSAESFESFAAKCLVAHRAHDDVGHPGLRAPQGGSETWELMPSVWTLEAALTKRKRKRRAVSDGGDPLEDRFCLQLFLFGFDDVSGQMGCIGATASTPFELESTRTMSRQRKAAAAKGAAALSGGISPVNAPTPTAQAVTVPTALPVDPVLELASAFAAHVEQPPYTFAFDDAPPIPPSRFAAAVNDAAMATQGIQFDELEDRRDDAAMLKRSRFEYRSDPAIAVDVAPPAREIEDEKVRAFAMCHRVSDDDSEPVAARSNSTDPETARLAQLDAAPPGKCASPHAHPLLEPRPTPQQHGSPKRTGSLQMQVARHEEEDRRRTWEHNGDMFAGGPQKRSDARMGCVAKLSKLFSCLLHPRRRQDHAALETPLPHSSAVAVAASPSILC